MNKVLIGCKAAGKTTVGRAWAEQLGWTFVDTDDAMAPVRETFLRLGEEGFREKESEVLKRFLGTKHHIIATGGGIPMHPAAADLLPQLGEVIFLDTPIEVLWDRIERDPPPFITSYAEFLELYQQRRPYYLKIADRIETDIWQVIGLEKDFASPHGESRTARR